MNLIDLLLLPRMIQLKSSVPGDLSFFRIGEILEGTVVQQVDDRHVMIQLRGRDFLAESHLPLSLNREGHFRVEATDPQVILKFIPDAKRENLPMTSWATSYPIDAPSLESLSKALVGLWAIPSEAVPPALRAKVEALQALVQRFSLKDPSSLEADDVKEILIRSGLFFEHQLKRLVEGHEADRFDQVVTRDLKGLAIRLKSERDSFLASEDAQGKPDATLREVATGLDRLLHRIEGFQTLNIHPSDPEGKLFLLLPLWFHNHLQFVEMSISPRPSSPVLSDSEAISIFFLLHMPDWGRVSIEAKVRGKDLYCLFKVTKPDIVAFLSQAFPELERRLMRIGLQTHLGVSVEDEKNLPQTFLSEALEKESLLDIII
ncbi:MAG: hypothetical protein ACUVWO_07785 [Thermodesulfobacteriota bacterium]